MLTVMLERRSSKQSQGTFEGEIHMTRARVANERCHVVLLTYCCGIVIYFCFRMVHVFGVASFAC